MTIINSTVSDNSAHGAVGDLSGGGIWNGGTLTLTHSTVWGNTADSGDAIAVDGSSYTEIANTLIDGDCSAFPPGAPDITSNGYNIESPGKTCGFDPDRTDQVDVTAAEPRTACRQRRTDHDPCAWCGQRCHRPHSGSGLRSD